MAFMQQSIQSNSKEPISELEQNDKTLEMMIGAPVIDAMIDNVVSTDNYIIFSTTKITWDGETKIVGIGSFGNVYLSSKVDDSFKKTIEQQ